MWNTLNIFCYYKIFCINNLKMEIGSDQRIVAYIDWKMFKYLVIMLEERMNEEKRTLWDNNRVFL